LPPDGDDPSWHPGHARTTRLPLAYDVRRRYALFDPPCALVRGTKMAIRESRTLALLMAGALLFLFADGRAVAAPSPKPAPPRVEVRDPNCPGKDNQALMCRLVNEYRAKNGLKPVRLDSAVSRQSQYWSDHLNKWHACWFLHHDPDYRARMKAAFPGRRFRENAACSGFEEGGAKYILEKWINSAGHRQNMLTPEWKTIGVGVTDNIWVINFTN
jgi:uncharacterized protein YkwD